MTDQDISSKRRLLLLSNSTNFGETFLAYPESAIKAFLGSAVKTIAFIPYAGVTISYADYAWKVEERFLEWGYEVLSLHNRHDKVGTLRAVDAIMIGGGNTFHLLAELYRYQLLNPIREMIAQGKPYIGWSAGSNVACPTIMTTNDMPIVGPPSLNALRLIPFQLNPHYIDAKPDGQAGESRADRLNEFITVNRDVPVVGLTEGSILRFEGPDITIIGDKPVKIFKYGQEVREVLAGEELRNI
ncbi:MAG: dipeptidase PepE [Candidatus Marinimicrobia bacterium]|nr:dipeptidase PepE [Candidatus Neomarinimicrobiota bacterium]